MRYNLLSLSLLAGLFLTACASGPRFQGEDEVEGMGGTVAGAATFSQLTTKATKELLTKYTNKVFAGATPTGVKVAFGGIENDQNEELGEWRAELGEVLKEAFSDFDGFRMISPRLVSAALNAGSLSSNDLFLPAGRRKFIKTLETQGNPVKALVFAKFTAGETISADGERFRRYRLSLDLVDTETGDEVRASTMVRKVY